MNMFDHLRVKGWIAITFYAGIGFLLNWMNGFDLTYFLLLCSCFVLNGFIYVYNDYNDAPYDKLDPLKAARNPFSGDDARKIRMAKIVMYLTPALTVLFALFVPFRCSVWIYVTLFLGYIYSSPHFRCKEKPFWDWFIHIFWLVLNFVPGYLYFFSADLRFYVLAVFCGVGSLISQINNELNDFVIDSQSNHRTTVILMGKRNTFYVRWFLECVFALLLIWLAVHYHYYAAFTVITVSFLCFVWVERIQVLGRIDATREFVKIRIGHVVTLWFAVWLMEAGVKKLI